MELLGRRRERDELNGSSTPFVMARVGLSWSAARPAWARRRCSTTSRTTRRDAVSSAPRESSRRWSSRSRAFTSCASDARSARICHLHSRRRSHRVWVAAGTAPDRFVVGLAVLNLLSDVAGAPLSVCRRGVAVGPRRRSSLRRPPSRRRSVGLSSARVPAPARALPLLWSGLAVRSARTPRATLVWPLDARPRSIVADAGHRWRCSAAHGWRREVRVGPAAVRSPPRRCRTDLASGGPAPAALAAAARSAMAVIWRRRTARYRRRARTPSAVCRSPRVSPSSTGRRLHIGPLRSRTQDIHRALAGRRSQCRSRRRGGTGTAAGDGRSRPSSTLRRRAQARGGLARGASSNARRAPEPSRARGGPRAASASATGSMRPDTGTAARRRSTSVARRRRLRGGIAGSRSSASAAASARSDRRRAAEHGGSPSGAAEHVVETSVTGAAGGGEPRGRSSVPNSALIDLGSSVATRGRGTRGAPIHRALKRLEP